MREATAEEVNKIIDEGNAILFGAGFTAGMFCESLGERCSLIRACIISGRPETNRFHGIPVYSLDCVDQGLISGAMILVAVHESNVETAEDALASKGITDTLWVYPVLHELAFGEVAYEKCYIPTGDLIREVTREANWLEIRYAAIKGFFEADAELDELYLQGMEMFSESQTALQRIERARKLAQSMRSRGFLEEYPVLLDEDLHMIDGLHRLAAAAWLDIRVIPCRMVKTSKYYDKLIPENVRASRNAVENAAGKETADRLLDLKAELLEKASKMLPEVSLIISVYNVETYIDQCMKSIVSQTFRNFEAILINDGSSDGSRNKCLEWAKLDGRIRFYDQDNYGVSPSRNKGVALSRGKYIGFVDPDDWLEPDYVKSLYRAITEDDTDIAECDIYRYNEKTGKEVYRAVYGKMGIPYTEEEHMKYAPTASYKSLYRKSLWTDNDIRMPECAFESPAVYAVVRALAKRTVNIRRPLYHYRVGRGNSLIETGYAGKDGSANNTLGIEAMSHLVSEFKRVGLYDRYKDVLNGLIKYRLSDILATQFTRKNETDYRETVQNFRRFLTDMFPEEPPGIYVIWGGYNLNRIMVYTERLQDPALRFNFSSMISLLEEDRAEGEVPTAPYHTNKYRRMMLEREFDRSFAKILKESKAEYIFVDFIEERFDILCFKGNYYTLSDAFEGAEVPEELTTQAERIDRCSEQCDSLWRRAFDLFREMINEKAPGCKLVIVENYLSREAGDAESRKCFSEADYIDGINKQLKEYYEYARRNAPEAIFVPAYTSDMYFTDKDYEYGAIPSHLNEVVNKKIARMTETAIRERTIEG